ncbi:MAG TPA: phytanoyl-CoA dioxygenase family protein [Reyranella sp.]|nr:phytanoyl-CoA dioxygenase family protein [Reyranella sp.]
MAERTTHFDPANMKAGSCSADMFLGSESARATALAGYRQSGYLIVDDVFSETELARMHETWKEIADGRKKAGNKPHATLLMTHLSMPSIAGIVRDKRLLHCVENVLGGKVELIQSQLMFGVPGNRGFSPHQDNFYNRPDPRDGIVAAWIALEDADEENGCLVIFPGSHHHGLMKTHRDWVYLLSRSPDVAKSLWKLLSGTGKGKPNDSGVIERYVYAEAPAGLEPMNVVMKAGSVAFMHGDLVHYSYPNRTESRFRRSFLTNYVRTGTSFASGRLTGRIPFDVYAG